MFIHPYFLDRISLLQSKNSRTLKKPDNVEETGVEESVCSVDGPSGVHPQQLGLQQPHQGTEITDLLATEITPISTITTNSKALK